ncbi:hypothetical protein [Aromatoleum evansii]|uniref:hypothetical protein n=1 Tax=Aromatoleum evansii TaxID=59406 RepID=UPI00145DEF77|nr:hypothetical protein [Aromatoleum evansii]NMG28425.1 hypothetical protein [Aromatoleum evansii]
MVYFRIRTAEGRRYVGSVQGFGGQLGGGAAHLGPEREKEVALRELQHCIDHLKATGRWGGRVLEVKKAPGHCYVKSVKDWKVPHDGAFNVCHVPLAGATVEVLSDEAVRAIPPGTCLESMPDEKVTEAARLLAGNPDGKAPGSRFQIGDRVSWVNDYGVKFPERTIIGRDGGDGDEPRYFLSPHDAWWMSIRESQLIADADDPVVAVEAGHKIRNFEIDNVPWFLVGLTKTACRTLEGALQFARENPQS